MNVDASAYARSALMVDMVQQGYIEFKVDEAAGGQFILSEDVAKSLILDHDNTAIRLNFPEELSALAKAKYLYWFMKGKHFVLSGIVDDMPYGFEFMIPLPSSLAENLLKVKGDIYLGVLSFFDDDAYDVEIKNQVKHKEGNYE